MNVLFANDSELILVTKAYVAEYIRHPLLNLGFIFSLAIATSTLLSILMLNDASKQQYQIANTRLKSPIAFNILPKNGSTISIDDFTALRAQGFSKINAVHVFHKTLANGKKISFRALDLLPFVLTAPESFTSQSINIGQNYVDTLDLNVKEDQKLALTDNLAISIHVNQVNDWGQVALVDIALAWQLFPDIKGFSHLMVGHMTDRELARLKLTLPDYLNIEQAWSIEEREGFADALHLNLSALAILGFIVSLFIAFQAANQAWSKRGELAAQLRLLGVNLKTIKKVFICESLILTLLASVVGAVIAALLVSLLLPMLGITLEQLYRLHVSKQFQWRVEYSVWAFSISFVAVTAALIKQFYVISSAKVALVARLIKKPFNYKITAIIAVMLLVIHVFWPTSTWAQLMFKYGLLLIASVAILPNILRALLSFIALFIHSFKFKYIFQDASQQVARRFLPIAAFYLALTSSIAAALMVNSFQHSFEAYLNQLLSADLFVRFTPEQESTLVQWIEKQNDIEEYTPFESIIAKYQSDTVEVYRLASKKQQESLILKSGEFVAFNTQHTVNNDYVDDTKMETACYINEQFAYKRLLVLQQVIELKHDQRIISCRIQGIYYDYGGQKSAIKIPSNDRIMGLLDWKNTGYGLFLKESNSSPEQKLHKLSSMKEALVNEFAMNEEQIYQSAQIKTFALAIFKQTFLLTQAIAFVLLSIACFGLFLSANSLEMARKSDLHILRCLGYSQKGLFFHMLSQWFILALGVILLSWPVAIILANALVSLILPSSFGWSMPLVLSIPSFVGSSLLGIILLIPALGIPLYKLNIKTSLS